MELLFDMTRNGSAAPFSALHIMWLGICLALGIWCRLMARRHDVLRPLGLALLISEALRVSCLFALGELDVGFLPLHLCSWAVYACIYHAATGSALAGELIYSTLGPGAVLALLFPDWLNYSPVSFIFLSSFGIHGLIWAYWLALPTSGFQPKAAQLKNCALCLPAFAGAVYIINRLLGTNYLFLMSPVPGTPLEWADRVLPWHGLIYIPGIALLWLVLYIRWPGANSNGTW